MRPKGLNKGSPDTSPFVVRLPISDTRDGRGKAKQLDNRIEIIGNIIFWQGGAQQGALIAPARHAYAQDGIVLCHVFQSSTDASALEDFIGERLHYGKISSTKI